jgi:hypothetical protein
LWLICWVAASVVVLILLAIWQGRAYVAYSDGVYAESARLVTKGLVPYTDFGAAQPPGIYYAGAVILWLGDSVEALRRGLAVVDLLLALGVLAIVWRLTRRRASAFVAGLLALATPWALLEHAQLQPETFAAPLLVAAMLAGGGRRTSVLAGVAGAAAGFFKVAFFLPAAAIAVAAAAPAPALIGLLASAAVAWAASDLAYGPAFWHSAVQAQQETGFASMHYVVRAWAQAGWNLLPLAVPAVVAFGLRARALRRPQFRVVVAGAVGSLGLLLTMFKQGSYINVLTVVEPPLLILAVCGWTWLVDRRGRPSNWPALTACGLAAALGFVEVGSLLRSPSDPRLFALPFSGKPRGWKLTDADVGRAVAAASRCPPTEAYSGTPYVAFVARRRMPGNQPDEFIIRRAGANARFLVAAHRDRPECPRSPAGRTLADEYGVTKGE